MDNHLLNIDEASSFLRLSKSKIYKLTSSRGIQFVKFGSRIFFKPDDLKSYIDSNTIRIIK